MKEQSYSGSSKSSHFPKKLKRSSSSSSPSPKSNRLSLISSIKDKTCPICLSQIAGHRPAIISNCNHAYCFLCLLRWSNYKRNCPLCNSHFDSYFSPSSLSSSFHKHRLLPLSRPRSPDPPHRQQTRAVAVQRLVRRTREEINAVNRQSRPVPRRRSFGREGSAPSEVIAERIIQWRASIYKHGLSAVPSSSRNLHNLNMSVSREHVLQRIEPWIQRELHAILQDPDPTIIVHVATSLYLSTFGKKTEGPSTPVDNVDNLAPLRPFLHEWTDVFWHELRCFAESYFMIDTYDEVVEYR